MFSLGSRYLPFCMWFLPLLFFTYQFILRLWPGLMMQTIMEQFAIDASHFGMLAAFYYYGYAGMQIPVAILLDRFSARYVIFFFATMCGLATLLFTYTTNFYIALLSRFLIGVGSAVGFLGVSKVVSEWFPKDQYAKMVGYSFTVGLMGAIYGGKPLSLLIEKYDWQHISVTLALISIALGLLTWLFLRAPALQKESLEEPEFNRQNMVEVLRCPAIWLLGLANLLLVGSLEGCADVWGVQYLVTAFELDKADAAGIISFTFVGMLFGGPVLVMLSKKFGNYNVIAASGFGMAAAFAVLLLKQEYNFLFLGSLFFLVGIMCCYQVIVFAVGAQLTRKESLSFTIAFLNCINMLGGSFFHIVIGRVMDLFWLGRYKEDGLRLYDLTTYKYALSAIPVCAIIGALMVVFIGVKIRNSR